jgi:predicted RNase H-like nuclease (RuvC/YqgF family)
MNDIGQQLVKIKNEINALKQKQAKKQGEIEACEKRLKELGCKDARTATNKITKLEEEIDKLEENLQDQISTLESELYGEGDDE